MKARLVLLAVALSAGLVGGVACGGGGDDDEQAAAEDTSGGERSAGEQPGSETKTPEPGPALTKDEFVAQANAACRANDERIITIAEEFAKTERSGFEPTAKEIRKFVVATLPEFRRMLDELARLTPPEPDQKAFSDLVDQGRDAVKRVDEIKDDSKTLLSREFGDAFATFNRGAFGLGLADCGEAERETFSGGGH